MTYRCCFPSICLKDGAQDFAERPYLLACYTELRAANYYDGYKATGKRATLGSYTLHEGSAGLPGIINCYIRVYPGDREMPSDNAETRKKYMDLILKDTAKKGYTLIPLEEIPGNDPVLPDIPPMSMLLYPTDYVRAVFHDGD